MTLSMCASIYVYLHIACRGTSYTYMNTLCLSPSFRPSLPPSLSLLHIHSLFPPVSPARSLLRSCHLSFSFSHSFSLYLSVFLPLPPLSTISLAFALSLSRARALSLALSLSLSLAPSCSVSLALSYSLSLSRSRCLMPSCCLLLSLRQ